MVVNFNQYQKQIEREKLIGWAKNLDKLCPGESDLRYLFK